MTTNCELVINPVFGSTGVCHHPVFSHFPPAVLHNASQLKSETTHGSPKRELVVDWLGVKVPRTEYCHGSYYRQRWAHALRVQLCDLLTWATGPQGQFPLRLPLPVASEEYFEYVDVLEAVHDFSERSRGGRGKSRRPFTMVEIGAGFGFWTLAAHAALQLLDRPQRPHEYALVLVEVDYAKQPLLKQMLKLNGVALGSARIVHAALGDRDERDGAIQNGMPGWYAVHTCDRNHPDLAHPGCKAKKFLRHASELDRANVAKQGGALTSLISLPTLLANYSLIDFVDIDVQGSEWAVFHEDSPGNGPLPVRSAFDVLDAKVLRVHFGTHGEMDSNSTRIAALTPLEISLNHSFVRRGWMPTWTMGVTNGACKEGLYHFRKTRWGPICMADGAMGYVNSRLRAKVGW